ncbi:hypothetical protein VCCP104114_0185 [Vibrio cholerae CP1041(14)]|nr:hypothetical protein VCCP104114_0185 [Vibrio cholerae CP1041(14)]
MTYTPPKLTIKLRTGIKQTFTYDFTRFSTKELLLKEIYSEQNLHIEMLMF